MKKDGRFGQILSQIIKFSKGDFTGYISISPEIDDVDAISAGLNALGEKLGSENGSRNGFNCEFRNGHASANGVRLKPRQADNSQAKNNEVDFDQLLLIFEHAPDAIVVLDDKGRVEKWNTAAHKIFGWTFNEVRGQLLPDLLVPESYRKSHLDELQRFLKESVGLTSSEKIKLTGQCKNGEDIQLEIAISSVCQNGLCYFIGFLRDRTELIDAEKEIGRLNATLEQRAKEGSETLLESERQYKNLFAHNPMPMWVLETPSLRFLDVNDSATSKYQYSRAEFLAMTSIDIRPDEEKAAYINLERASTGTQNRGIWKHLKKDGSVVYAEIVAHHITFEGRTARLVMANDVTERKKAEDSLKLSESRFKKIFDSKLVGFAVWDTDKTILQANDLFLNMLGFTRQELENGSIDWYYVTPEEYRGLDKLAMQQLSSTWVCEPFEKEYIRKDQTRLPVLIAAARIEKNLYVSYILDISQRKKLSNEILELNKNLEDRVIARTAELLEANKELESFSYSVSHDLRAPLRAIHGYSQMLAEDYEKSLEPDGIRLLDNIKANAKKMGQLVDDLLTFSRMGKRPVNRSRIDMSMIVANVLATLEYDPKNIEIKVHPLGPENADPALMALVFENLISNSVKYSKRKSRPKIEVGCTTFEDRKTYFVKDNGSGFDMQYYDKLFGVFQRLHGEKEFDGTGVGFAIVHRIITKHGGRIWADAKIDEGATFYFTLNKKEPS